ncbi:hypothetical protein K438DRAFT_1900145 [Mycena galopus ATCC 62051]|nr:hypothetical protein K438DRAFT_1900145 [Mycena galopus ATCC 62051]
MRTAIFLSFSTSMHPLSERPNRKPSLELSRFSTLFQQWELASGEASPTSRRGSHVSSDFSAGSQTSTSRPDDMLGPPLVRQRTTQACDKCRDRKTKCSGDHPNCKRCTARGLICHYSERERVRGPSKARLRNAMSSSSLDLRFEAEAHDLPQSPTYPREYLTDQQSQYHHPSFSTQPRFPYSQPCSQAASPALDPPELSGMSLRQATHRRVQSHSSLGAMYRQPLPSESHPTNRATSRLGASSVIEFDMRLENGGGCVITSSEPLSGNTSVFSNELISRSSGSSQSTFPEPLSRSASEVDLRLLSQMHEYRHQRLCNSEDAGKVPCLDREAFQSPVASVHSFNELSSGRPSPGNIYIPRSTKQEKMVTVRDVPLMYPSPVTPITLTHDAIDRMARGGLNFSYDHVGNRGPSSGFNE